MKKPFSFGKHLRLHRKRDWDEIRKSGIRKELLHFVVVYRLGQSQEPRLGISVSRKVGGAIARTRIKRLIRETFRLNREEIFKDRAVDCLVIIS